MIFVTRRRLLAGLLVSTALLTGCARVPAAAAAESTGTSSSTQSLPADSPHSSETEPASSSPERNAPANDEATAADGSAPAQAGENNAPLEEGQPASGPAALSSYDFSQPCPESPAVENDYFEDAAFVGDSRTDGFMIYSGIGCGENLTSNGLSIFKLAEKKALTIDGEKYTLLEALALKEYGKVYLSLGVNELGYNNDKGFYEAYCNAIDAIRACQPNAVIYIQGLIPLNEDVIAATGGADYLTNKHLLIYNDLMKKAAEEKQVAFLDLNPVFTGADGQLPEDASGDGVHLRSSYCKQWLEYLKTHTVSYDTLYAG